MAQGCVAGHQNLADQALVRAPDVTLDVGGDYQTRLIPGWTTDLAIDGDYTSSYQTAGDSNPGGIQSSFWKLNAAVHFTSEALHCEFSVIGRNLTNAYYLLTSNSLDAGLPTQFDGFFNRPREVIIQAEYHL